MPIKKLFHISLCAALLSNPFALLALFLASPLPALANPAGGQVVGGSANITGGGQTLTINQASDLAIIDWNSFSINSGELTQFIQPSALSAALNRVTGGDPSAIYGALQANGRVFLINPNGVTVGPSGVINAQSFIASTLDLDDGRFLAGGDLLFSGGSMAGISNAGQITALGGDVLLIAHTVANTGGINAAYGTAALAAGSEVLFKPDGDRHVFVQAGAGTAAVGVDQGGQVHAAAAELAAAGGNVYGVAINNSGVVRADAVQTIGGRVFLTAGDGTVVNSGELTAKNGNTGGAVQVTGGAITLKSGSLVDVSGADGGGTALIGGDEHGANAAVPNASRTTVEAGAAINADAVNTGDGGKVVVWSDDRTDFRGHISARGGALGGNGGFAEVSGKRLLNYRGLANLSAPKGAAGTLLLDPYDVYIVAGVPPSPNGTWDSGDPDIWSAGTNDSQLYVADILNNLNTANVQINTGVGGSQAGNITVNASINYMGVVPRTLSLIAANDIAINASVTGSDLNLVLNTTALGGAINLNSGINTNSLTTQGGQTNINTAAITTAGAQIYNSAVELGANTTLTSNGDDISFAAGLDGGWSLTANTTGDKTFNGAVGLNTALTTLSIAAGGATNLNGGSVTTSGAQTYNGAVLLGADTMLASTGGNIGFGSTVNGGYALAVNTAGNKTFGGAVALTSLNTAAGGTTRLNGDTVMTTGEQTYSGNVVLGANTTLTASDDIEFGSSVDGGYSLAVNTAGDIIFGGAVGIGTALSSLNVDAVGTTRLNGGAVKTTGEQTYSGAVLLGTDTTLTSANIDFGATVNGAYALAVNSSGNKIFNGSIGLGTALMSLNVAANGNTYLNGGAVTTTGTQTYSGPVFLGADTTLTSSAGDIAFASMVNSVLLASPVNLTANSADDITFYTVGGINPLSDLAVDAGGSIRLNGSAVITTGKQTYSGPVLLGANEALTANGDITFNSTVDGPGGLAVNSSSGYVFFYGLVGGLRELDFLSAASGAGRQIEMYGGGVTTAHEQTYNTWVHLLANTALTGGGNITFASKVYGAGDLTVNSSGDVEFDGLVGGMIGDPGLYSLAVNAGNIFLNSAFVTTRDNQTYNAPVVLGANTLFHGNNISFASTLDGGWNPYLDAARTVFGGAVGRNTALGTLEVAGDLSINGGEVRTTGAQTYSRPALLGADTVLSGSALTLTGLNAQTHDLTLDFTGAVTAGPAITNVGDFVSQGSGGTRITGDFTTSNSQTYANNVLLAANNATLTGTKITFRDALNSAAGSRYALTLNGDAEFDGAVGATDRLAALKATGSNITWNASLNVASLKFFGTDLVMNGDVNSDGTDGVLMTAANSFKNANSRLLNTTGGGKALIYSVSPEQDVFGGLPGPYQYGTSYPAAPSFDGSGFLFSIPGQGWTRTTPAEQTRYQALAQFPNNLPTPFPRPSAGGASSVRTEDNNGRDLITDAPAAAPGKP